MGLSKSQRITILLAIDGAFFLVELIVGYAVHSLALVADAFHMLNDVLSLCVGLWAVKVANSGSSKMYTYGWQRAETLGALVNGVFLVALCVTIFLEAIQRFVEVQPVSNPKLVLIVGCLGLASNILGLALFHDHGHSHGGDGHSHGDDGAKVAEEGHAHTHSHGHEHADEETRLLGDNDGSIEDVLPQVRVAGYNSKPARGFSRSDEENTTLSGKSSDSPVRKSVSANANRRRKSSSFGRGFGSVDNIQVHPASFRNDFIQASRLDEQPETDSPSEDEESAGHDHHGEQNGEVHSESHGHSHGGYGSINHRKSTDYDHNNHIHNKPKQASTSGGGHGHSHADLNMRGVFLHVMGDALGNIGVIITALIIWLTTWEGRYYFDPAVSLVITVIILCSAIPLCKAASRILLQAVPVGLSIDEITADIESLPRVVEAHHLHVWQLSDTKLVASLHVKVDCEVEGAGSASYMHLAREIRACLHGYGIHSSTIQPEFLQGVKKASSSQDEDGDSPDSSSHDQDHNKSGPTSKPSNGDSKAASLRSAPGECLLDCEDDCSPKGQCCPPADVKGQK